MLKVYKEEMRLRTRDCDFNGAWRPGAVLENMQEIAGTHSDILGIGRNELALQNMVWIITRMEVVMDRWPKLGDLVESETFPMPVRRWFFPRYYVFRDDAGSILGQAATLWALMDIRTRRLASPDSVRSLLPDNSDLPAPLSLPGPVQEISGTLETNVFSPVYTDLDVNGHVNNVRYMDWCCNALGIDTMRDKQFRSFTLNYNEEVRPGAEVRGELRRLGDAFSYCGFTDGKRCFDIGGELADRT